MKIISSENNKDGKRIVAKMLYLTLISQNLLMSIRTR